MTRSDFWSRRKSAVQAEAEAEAVATAAAQEAAEDAALSQRDDATLLAEAGLPEPETLESAEQVQEFLRAALPKRLKTRALRQLWRLNPVLANVDGLVDYGEDYTDSATVVADLQTVYQVGKGMITRMVETAEAPEPPAPQDMAAVAPTDPAPEPPTAEPSITPPQQHAEQDDWEENVTLPASKRRMQFHFDPPKGA